VEHQEYQHAAVQNKLAGKSGFLQEMSFALYIFCTTQMHFTSFV
jgi:hypothetical protein